MKQLSLFYFLIMINIPIASAFLIGPPEYNIEFKPNYEVNLPFRIYNNEKFIVHCPNQE